MNDLSWRWHTLAGRSVLLANEGGVVLSGAHQAHLMTRDCETGSLRALAPSDPVAKIIASAPDIRRHAQALIHGIDIGEVVFEHESNPALDEILRQLRVALTNSGAT
jgi:hypothetical protein